MELCTALIAYMKGERMLRMIHPLSFLNVSQGQNFKTFWTILAVKCIISGYGTKYLVPKYLTTALIFANIVSICILGVSGNMPFIITYNIAAAGGMLQYHDRNVAIMIGCWAVASLDVNLQFLLDVYTVMTVLLCIFKIFAKEYEKALTLICVCICLDWGIDNYHHKNTLTFFDVALTFMLQGCLFTALRPLRRQFFRSYIFICASVVACTVFKYYRIAALQGISVYPEEGRFESFRSIYRSLWELTKECFARTEKMRSDAQTFMTKIWMRKMRKYVSKSPETGDNITTLILDMNASKVFDFNM